MDVAQPANHLRSECALLEDQEVDTAVAQGKARVDGAELGVAREVPQVQGVGLGTQENGLVLELCELGNGGTL